MDYDHALNIVVAKIRRVLNDSPDKPRYIQTIPKRGYRFIAAAELVALEPAPADLKIVAAPQPEAAGLGPVPKSPTESMAQVSPVVESAAAHVLRFFLRQRL